jgi:hypothetical protein
MDSAPARAQLHFWAPSWPKTQQCLCPFPTIIPRRVYALPQSRGADRRQPNTSYFSCSRNRLGSGCFENRTECSGHRSNFGWSRERTAHIMVKHRRWQPHVQKLLGPMEFLRCEERHIRTPLGIRRRSKITQIIFPRSRVNDVITELHGGPSGSHLGVYKALNKVRQRYYWLHAQESMLRSGHGSATPVKPVAAPEPGIGAKCISTSGSRSKG